MTDNTIPQDCFYFLTLSQILQIQYKFLGPKTTAAPTVDIYPQSIPLDEESCI